MKKELLQTVKATFCLMSLFAFLSTTAQQQVIANKDNTHPEQSTQQYITARVLSFAVRSMNGYNEIKWNTTNERDTRRYIVEYTNDGLNYLSAGEQIPVSGDYTMKHHILDQRASLYRIKIEKKDGRFSYSGNILLDGAEMPAVLLYPTIVENNTINLKMDLPVQRIEVISSEGRLIFSKQMGGLTGSTQVIVPVLSKGTYFMHFIGDGWKTTSKFMVAN
ncbi:MAG TPA: T9SS type A sorting domain-containing protein [Chitinophagaceae bacterium]